MDTSRTHLKRPVKKWYFILFLLPLGGTLPDVLPSDSAIPNLAGDINTHERILQSGDLLTIQINTSPD
ncbi:MAG: hypothetical protein AAB619_00050 [Patescibacteria group bacterium]